LLIKHFLVLWILLVAALNSDSQFFQCLRCNK
jgi:hypothetical protein